MNIYKQIAKTFDVEKESKLIFLVTSDFANSNLSNEIKKQLNTQNNFACSEVKRQNDKYTVKIIYNESSDLEVAMAVIENLGYFKKWVN